MRSLFRHLGSARQRWRRMMQSPDLAAAFRDDLAFRKKLLMEAFERQRTRQRRNPTGVQLAFFEQCDQASMNLRPKIESHERESYLHDAILNSHSMDSSGLIVYRRGATLGSGQVQNLLQANKHKFQNSFNEKKEHIKGVIEDAIQDKSEAFNSEINKRKDKLREAIHSRRLKFSETLEEHREDLSKAMQLRRKSIKDAVATRKDRLRRTEEKIMLRGKFIMQDIRETKERMKEKMEQVVEKENIYTVPNLLCVTRIAFSPYLGYLIISGSFEYALGFMVVASISDFMDGWIARNFKSQSSKIGSFLDPMADKILIGTLFLSLTYVDLIPLALTGLIVARDAFLVGAGFVIRYKSLPPPRTLSRYFDATHATAQLAPTLISKVNTGVQLLLVASTLAAPVFYYTQHPALSCLCYITAATTVLSAGSYLFSKDTYRYLRNQR